MTWIIARLRENSTWRGIVWLLTVAGLSLRPDQAEAIITAGMAVAGLLGVFTSDQPQHVHLDPDPPLPPIDLHARPEQGDAAWGIGAVQPADELRLSTQRRPGAAGTADPNTQPNPAGFIGFGDRD